MQHAYGITCSPFSRIIIIIISTIAPAERANHLNGNRFRRFFRFFSFWPFICSPNHNLATWHERVFVLALLVILLPLDSFELHRTFAGHRRGSRRACDGQRRVLVRLVMVRHHEYLCNKFFPVLTNDRKRVYGTYKLRYYENRS